MEKTIQNLKIIFMGTPEFSEIILSSLIENKYPIISVYTQPDKKIGRKQKIQSSPVKILAEKNNISVFQPLKLRDEIESIKKQAPDLIIVAAYGKIIPQEILDIPRLKCINVHPSLLPKYRGASPIQNALLKGERKTGTTIMLMTKDVDAGDILNQVELEINPQEKLPELSVKLAQKSALLLIKTLPDWINSKIKPQKQDEAQVSFCQMLSKEDGEINWQDSAESIFNRFRAFYPWPGVFTFWNGKRIQFDEIELLKNFTQEGKIGEISERDNKVLVKSSTGAIIIKVLRLEGKNSTDIKSFINGHPNFIGSILK